MEMRRFKLSKNTQTEKWELQDETTEQVLKVFRTRDQALGRRIIERAIDNAGYVTLYRVDGTIAKVMEYPLRERR